MSGADVPDPETVGSESVGADSPGAGGEERVEPAARRVVRRRPEQSRDDTDRGWGERVDEDEHDRWLREQRPPHWD
ncbi:hypothetical protein GCM10027055_04260 [Janibacter alkaliphilus]|uniref:Uncharacterized protein n=1 Tax=Janibacter alkaliphilus TaxID=1069963 RepID=A0A852XF04_9MICO|nr:hypothetical protein [Janibacter alkaliphilus]NYG37041.1 hypothetical protein [Janibacter alkaliphilus]